MAGLAALVFLGFTWGFVELLAMRLRRPLAVGRIRRALARRAPRRARALARLAARDAEDPAELAELARLEAEAYLWDGAFARVHVPEDPAQAPATPLLLTTLALLLAERVEDARPLLAAARLYPELAGTPDLLAARALEAYLDDHESEARARFDELRARAPLASPLRVTADFFLAALAHRRNDAAATRHHLACACTGGDLVVARWARETWRELYTTSPPERPAPRRNLLAARLLDALGALRAGPAAFLFLTRASARIPGSLRRVAPLGVLAALVVLACTLLRAVPGAEEPPPFLQLGVLALAPVLFVVPAAIVTGRTPRGRLRLLGAFYAASPLLVLVTFALAPFGDRLLGAQLAVATWSALVFARLGWALAHARGLRLALGLLVFALGWIVPLRAVILPFPAVLVADLPGPPLPTPPRLAPDEVLREIEARAFVESALLRDHASALANERPGVPDLYFVAFGGWASQDVFVNEVRNARALLDERWDTRGRSLALANDPSSRGELALATPIALRHALEALAAKMDRDEDVLFLFLTSHGSSEGLALSYPPSSYYPRGTFAPADLRAMLDATSIRWRVLVVAGCESGVFADALASDTTLVATAAANDRNSYGCAAGNAYTEFGKALFGEELRKTYDLPAALEASRAAVTAREKADGRLPSEPRILVGPAIVPKLRALQTRLEARP